jgi:hypothetical protein
MMIVKDSILNYITYFCRFPSRIIKNLTQPGGLDHDLGQNTERGSRQACFKGDAPETNAAEDAGLSNKGSAHEALDHPSFMADL